MTAATFDWTDEAVAELKRLWAADASASAAAAALMRKFGGYATRNGVIGKARRLRLPARQSGYPSHDGYARQLKNGNTIIVRPLNGAAPPPPVKRQKVKRLVRAGSILSVTKVLEGAVPVEERADDFPVEHRKTLLELTKQTCRWPCGNPGSGDFFFCGAPEADLAAGIPYCRRHMLKACARTAAPSIAPRRAA